jgi:hypothetical protein
MYTTNNDANMKTTLLKPAEFKAFTIGAGISVAVLTLSFLISFYGETREKIQSRSFKPVPAKQHEPVYTEIRGMN